MITKTPIQPKLYSDLESGVIPSGANPADGPIIFASFNTLKNELSDSKIYPDQTMYIETLLAAMAAAIDLDIIVNKYYNR